VDKIQAPWALMRLATLNQHGRLAATNRVSHGGDTATAAVSRASSPSPDSEVKTTAAGKASHNDTDTNEQRCRAENPR
jgi:hypothetical protein